MDPEPSPSVDLLTAPDGHATVSWPTRSDFAQFEHCKRIMKRNRRFAVPTATYAPPGYNRGKGVSGSEGTRAGASAMTSFQSISASPTAMRPCLSARVRE